jgi:site-specific DNA-methyltransferase (adenine-specific)
MEHTDRSAAPLTRGLTERTPYDGSAGRWPANVILTDPIFDGGVEGVVGGGEQATHAGKIAGGATAMFGNTMREVGTVLSDGDSGTYSRFFLIPKADRADREPVLGGPTQSRAILGQGIGGADNRGVPRANVHPTVKPTDLMRHLVRLVTPPGGTVLDPFLGSGTTALAAELEGFPWLGIEREAEYVAIAEARLNGTQRGLGLDTPAPVTPRKKMPPHVGPGTPWPQWATKERDDVA